MQKNPISPTSTFRSVKNKYFVWPPDQDASMYRVTVVLRATATLRWALDKVYIQNHRLTYSTETTGNDCANSNYTPSRDNVIVI